jgi:hypothetical protein
MFEEVSSIVAPSVDIENGDLLWLESNGLWRPTHVNLGYAEGYRDEIENVLLEFADRDSYRFDDINSLPSHDLARIYAGKLARELEQSMVDLRLAVVEPRRGSLLAHREVAAIVLTITAKYIAMAHRDPRSRVTPSTDLPIFEKIAYDPLRGSQDRFRCLELLLEGLVPVPGSDVSLPGVIDFRQRYRDELGALRVEITRMLRVIQSSQDPFDEVRSMREEIENAVAQLKRAARSRRLGLVAGTCSVLALGLAVGTALPGETLHWVFDGFGTTAVATFTARLVRGRPSNDAFAYLLSAHSAFD